MPEIQPNDLLHVPIKDAATFYIDDPTFLSSPDFFKRLKTACQNQKHSDDLALITWLLLLAVPDKNSEKYMFFSDYLGENLMDKSKQTEFFHKVFQHYSLATQEIDLYLHRVEGYKKKELQTAPPDHTSYIAVPVDDPLGDAVLERALQRYAKDTQQEDDLSPDVVVEYFKDPANQGFGLFVSKKGEHFAEVGKSLVSK